jgi:hypothetical protein
MDISIRLRSARKAVLVAPERSVECVLGTDFIYEDLRFWLPSSALENCQLSAENGAELVIVGGDRSVTGCGRVRMRIGLDAEHAFPRLIEWIDPESRLVHRTYRAGSLVSVDNIWSPAVISVSRPLERYLSIMTLRHLVHDIKVDADIFREETLFNIPAFDDWLRLSTRIDLPAPSRDTLNTASRLMMPGGESCAAGR